MDLFQHLQDLLQAEQVKALHQELSLSIPLTTQARLQREREREREREINVRQLCRSDIAPSLNITTVYTIPSMSKHFI